MLPVAAPLNVIPPAAQPQVEAVRRDNARFEPIPEPTGLGAGSRTRAEADDYDRNRTGTETREAATRAEPGNTPTNDRQNTSRVDPDGRNPQSQQQGQPDAQERNQQRQEQQQIAELRSIDRAVRAHEAAHAAVGGQYAGAPFYQYQRGPDGKRYAVGGEVSIDVSTVPDNPQATIRKLETVRAAALAPADPSPQDRQVAARATALIAEARRQLAIQAQQEAAPRESSRTAAGGKSRLASDASSAVFGDSNAVSSADLQSEPASRLTVFRDAALHSPCPLCSRPHLSPVASASLASHVPLPDRLRSLGVAGPLYSAGGSREFRVSA